MTDLAISVRLQADGSGLVGQLKLSRDEVDRLKGAMQPAATAARQLDAASGSLARQSRQTATALDAQGRASGELEQILSRLEDRYDRSGAPMRRYQSDLADIGRLLKANVIDVEHASLLQGRATQAFEAAALAQRRGAVSTGQMRAAYQQLGFQVQDVTQQLALGINPMVVLAQQGGQVASAFALMGNGADDTGRRVGGLKGAALGFANFLAGPWGAALTGAALVVAMLGSSLFETEKATVKAADATDAHKLSAQELADAIRDLDAASAKLVQTTQMSEIRSLNAATAKLNEAVATRDLAKAKLEELRAEIQAARFRSQGTGVSSDNAGLRLGSLGAELAEVNANIAEQQRLIDSHGKTVRAAMQPIVQRQVAESLDATTAATGAYERQLGSLSEQLRIGAIDWKEYQQQSRDAELERDRAIKAAQDAARENKRNSAENSKADREAAKAAREAAKIQRELESTLASLTRHFDPATAAANTYAEALADIARLRQAGLLTPEQADQFTLDAKLANFDAQQKILDDRTKKTVEELSYGFKQAMEGPIPTFREQTVDAMTKAGRAGANAFRQEGIEAAQAISQIFGGDLGRMLGSVFGALSGVQTGNFNSVGGPLGGVLTLLTGGRAAQGNGRIQLPYGGSIVDATQQVGGAGGFADGLRDVFRPIQEGFDGLLGKLDGIFGGQGSLTRMLGQAAGGAAIGSVTGKGLTDLLGLKGSATGGTIGGALGSVAGEKLLGKSLEGVFKGLGDFAGPIGSIVGSLAGSLLGGMLSGTKRGSATITSADGDISTRGNSSKREQAAMGLGGSIQDAIRQIADTLGGELGKFAVSIGIRDDNFRVDRSGRGITKTKNGAVDFGQDQAAAISFAIADAIADGAVTGLSAAVQRALKSSTDVDKALQEALKVQEVEQLLKGLGGELESMFKDFERQAAERVRIARQYGFDLVKLEKLNAEQRAKMFEDVLADRVGSLQQLLDDLKFGDLFEGSLTDQRDKLLVEIAKARADAEAGKDGAADRLASLNRQLLGVSRDAYGTAGGEFAADRSGAISSAEEIIRLENERVKAAQDAAIAANQKLDKNNDLTNETNDILSEIRGLIRSGAMIVPGAGASARRDITTSRPDKL